LVLKPNLPAGTSKAAKPQPKEILAKRPGEIRSLQMKTALISPNPARSSRHAERSSFVFFQAVCGFSGLAGARYRFFYIQQSQPPSISISKP
jgi:hypothetical protein